VFTWKRALLCPPPATVQVNTLFVIVAEISKAVSAAMQLKFALRRALR